MQRHVSSSVALDYVEIQAFILDIEAKVVSLSVIRPPVVNLDNLSGILIIIVNSGITLGLCSSAKFLDTGLDCVVGILRDSTVEIEADVCIACPPTYAFLNSEILRTKAFYFRQGNQIPVNQLLSQ